MDAERIEQLRSYRIPVTVKTLGECLDEIERLQIISRDRGACIRGLLDESRRLKEELTIRRKESLDLHHAGCMESERAEGLKEQLSKADKAIASHLVQMDELRRWKGEESSRADAWQRRALTAENKIRTSGLDYRRCVWCGKFISGWRKEMREHVRQCKASPLVGAEEHHRLLEEVVDVARNRAKDAEIRVKQLEEEAKWNAEQITKQYTKIEQLESRYRQLKERRFANAYGYRHDAEVYRDRDQARNEAKELQDRLEAIRKFVNADGEGE